MPLYTSIFPEHERRCHVQVHEELPENEVKCRTPLGYVDDHTPMTGLMTLSTFVGDGHDVLDGKVLVCVKSVGARKKSEHRTHPPKRTVSNDTTTAVTRKDATTTAETTTIHVFDNTASASITLWDAATPSASLWKPHHTILLLTRPTCRTSYGSQTWLNIAANTTVDVDPATRDARWLRAYALRLLKRPECNPASPPAGTFPSAREIERAETRVLYTLADLDAAARVGKKVVGFISVVLTEINLVALCRRNMLACAECACGHPLYANQPSLTCPHCDAQDVPLRLNPRILGTVVDETGSVATGKLVLAEEAWGELLGRGVAEVVGAEMEVLRALEERLGWVRVTLVVGWVGGAGEEEEGVGRVCVVGVRM